MTQHTFVIPNEAGAAFRADVNGAAQALASMSSGAVEPATKYPFQQWADTSTGKLKIRNAANNAWIIVGTLASVGLGLPPMASGTFTRDMTLASSNYSVTGLAFQPRIVTMSVGIAGGGPWGSTGGITDGTGGNTNCLEVASNPVAPQVFVQVGFLGFIRSDNAGSNYLAMAIVSLDSGGFTIAWGKAGAPTGTATCIWGAIG